jgi:hypothetical protein
MTKPAVEHPIWSLLRSVVMFGGLTLLLYFNASNFDGTEMRVILELLILRGAWEGFERKMKKNGKSKAD